MARRPEVLLLPFAALFLGVNAGPWGYGVQYIWTFFVYLSFQASNEIFPLTWSAAWILFGFTLWMLYRRRVLAWWRSFIVAGTLPFLAIGIFEIPYDLAIWHFHPDYGVTPFILGSIGLWFLLGFTSIGWWKVTPLYWGCVAVFAGGYIGWALVGFPTIYAADAGQRQLAYAFNVGLKAGCFVLAGMPVFERLRFGGGPR